MAEVEMNHEHMLAFMRRRARQLGKSLKSLASEAGLARTYLYKLSDGSIRDPSVGTLVRLARALDIAPVALLRFYVDLRVGKLGKSWGSRTLPTAMGLANSDDVVRFNGDVTVADHAPMNVGECFRKVWEIQNVGTVPWHGRQLVRVDRQYVIAQSCPDGSLIPLDRPHLVSLHEKLAIPSTGPGDVVRLHVDFVAPPQPCSVVSIWRVEDGRGDPCHAASFFLHVAVTVIA